MRRTTAATIVEQAKLLYSLIMSSPDSTLMHHARDIEQYFRMLMDRCEITHSISPRFPEKKFTVVEKIFPPKMEQAGFSLLIQDRILTKMILRDIVDRNIKVVPK